MTPYLHPLRSERRTEALRQVQLVISSRRVKSQRNNRYRIVRTGKVVKLDMTEKVKRYSLLLFGVSAHLLLVFALLRVHLH